MSDQPKSAIERAKEYGIDVTLLEANLRKTPTERLETLIAMMALYMESQRQRSKQFGAATVRDRLSGYSSDSSKQ